MALKGLSQSSMYNILRIGSVSKNTKKEFIKWVVLLTQLWNEKTTQWEIGSWQGW